jgi:hypothetical protein
VEIIRILDVKDPVTDPLAMILDLGEKRGKKQVSLEKPVIENINAIKTELESFYSAIVNNTTPPVTINDGYEALDVAYQILRKVQEMQPGNLLA